MAGASALVVTLGVWEWQTPSTTVVDWLNGNGAAVTAAATVVLAAVTWALVASSSRGGRMASEATMTHTRAFEGLPLMTVVDFAPDLNDAGLGPRLRFGNRGDGMAEDVRVRIESFPDHNVDLPRQALTEWWDLGVILPGSEYPIQWLSSEGDNEPFYFHLPITHLREDWGALEHHDEWLAVIEYRSVGGTRLRNTWTQTGRAMSQEVLS